MKCCPPDFAVRETSSDDSASSPASYQLLRLLVSRIREFLRRLVYFYSKALYFFF